MYLVLSCVTYRGSSAIDIFFNVLSVSFLLHVDNVAYTSLVSHEARSELEMHARMTLDSGSVDALQGTRIAVPFVCFAQMMSLALVP